MNSGHEKNHKIDVKEFESTIVNCANLIIRINKIQNIIIVLVTNGHKWETNSVNMSKKIVTTLILLK